MGENGDAVENGKGGKEKPYIYKTISWKLILAIKKEKKKMELERQ